MIDIIVTAVIILIIGGATAYIIKAKKSGKKCIGCPDGCCSCKNSANSTACKGCSTSDADKNSK